MKRIPITQRTYQYMPAGERQQQGCPRASAFQVCLLASQRPHQNQGLKLLLINKEVALAYVYMLLGKRMGSAPSVTPDCFSREGKVPLSAFRAWRCFWYLSHSHQKSFHWVSIWVYRVNRATKSSLTERSLSDSLKCLPLMCSRF